MRRSNVLISMNVLLYEKSWEQVKKDFGITKENQKMRVDGHYYSDSYFVIDCEVSDYEVFPVLPFTIVDGGHTP